MYDVCWFRFDGVRKGALERTLTVSQPLLSLFWPLSVSCDQARQNRVERRLQSRPRCHCVLFIICLAAGKKNDAPFTSQCDVNRYFFNGFSLWNPYFFLSKEGLQGNRQNHLLAFLPSKGFTKKYVVLENVQFAKKNCQKMKHVLARVRGNTLPQRRSQYVSCLLTSSIPDIKSHVDHKNRHRIIFHTVAPDHVCNVSVTSDLQTDTQRWPWSDSIKTHTH